MASVPTLRVLGIRGVPAAHGGFETFAERLAQHLVDRGWRVVVYCQREGAASLSYDNWQGVERVNISVRGHGARSSVVFDWQAIKHAAQHRDLCLTLGYNTALFCARLRLHGVVNAINMDGIEWRRDKWGLAAKAWFWANDWAGCWLGNQLIADHPAIADHLATRVGRGKINTIAYGADLLQSASDAPVRALGLEPGRYLTLIARPEPENSILEVVRGFSERLRGATLAVLGAYDDEHVYHRAVRAAAGPEVKFLGAIYDRHVVQALRLYSMAYIHGHRVGGTNPSLVEALGAGNAVVAHDNRYNRWVAGDSAAYFTDGRSLAGVLDKLMAQPGKLDAMRSGSRQRFAEAFDWPRILRAYEELLMQMQPASA